ncbi:hypothetical protein J8N05_07820 [Streptomyces sp. BH-SS-21]|uniref:DUF4232 domain-containing protein n=1 Tax=Streptomyces liliiviolaceus TaxID=2823109 RepID=A0A940XSI6_9ACTN|nr:hypothetical protein [Streptomyces liliiviolaceus]MBQ0848118.1 hypothetical protein [Streptomyces liliiviolaceus]
MSGHDERARHDEHGRHGDDDEQEQHAGNGTVNHGPSENPGPEESGRTDTEGRPSDPSPDRSAGGSSDDPTHSTEPVEPVEPIEAETETEAAGSAPEKASGDAPTKVSPLAPLSALSSLSAQSAQSSKGSSGDADESGPDVFGSDELALRRLLHQAVEEIEPTDGTLDHLRRAVPARRARKRQALVGMAAAALFIGTAVPALVHVSNSTGSNADPSMAGNTSATQGGANEGKESSSGSGSGDSSGSSKGSGKGDKKDDTSKGKGGDGGSAGTQPTASTASAPTCTSMQLTAVAGGGTPDATGAVYGTFTVTNVSTASCTVVGSGSVSSTALGAADQSQLSTVLHMAGDAAAGLPDPSTYASSLLLPPGGTYNVKFAWVPSATCPTSGGNGGGEPSPDPTPTEDPTGDSGGTASEGTSGAETQLMRADGTVDGSVSVSYTAEGGAPATATTVSNACAGTVYRTGVLAGS